MIPISLTTSENIDGAVTLNPSWGGLHSVARLDLLQDWIAVLKQLYQLTHHDTYGKGYNWHNVCIEAISGWENHGKNPEDYPAPVVNLARPAEEGEP
jgi:hypothetical protein